MQITIDTNNLSDLDINMLAFLAEQGEVAEADEDPEEETPAPAAKKAAPAKKAAAKKAEPKAKEEPEEDDAEPEAEEEAEAETDGAPSMSDAVAAATQLVSAGEAAKVKAALAEVGAKRVSEMDEDDIPTFLAALEAAE